MDERYNGNNEVFKSIMKVLNLDCHSTKQHCEPKRTKFILVQQIKKRTSIQILF
jgi:hypothetical protein